MLFHLAGCLVLLTTQLFRDSHLSLPWRPQGPPPLPPTPFARVTDTLRPGLSCAQVVRVGFPSLCLAFFCRRAGPVLGCLPGGCGAGGAPALFLARFV